MKKNQKTNKLMKKILLLLVAAVCAAASWAADATVSATVKGQKLEVALANDAQSFVAFQMDITLPAGVDVENTGAVVMNTDRLTEKAGTPVAGAANANFIIAYNKIDATHVRVLAYNLENRALAGTSGELFSMTFTGTTDANFTIDGIKFVTETELNEINLAVAESVKASGLVGDVYADEVVDIADITAIAAIINGKSNPKYNEAAANVYDKDDVVDVADITALAAIINKTPAK